MQQAAPSVLIDPCRTWIYVSLDVNVMSKMCMSDVIRPAQPSAAGVDQCSDHSMSHIDIRHATGISHIENVHE